MSSRWRCSPASDPRKIVLNGANKAEDALRGAIDVGVMIQVDHEDELEAVERLAGEMGKTARVALRIRLPLNAIEEVVYVDPRYPEGISPTYWERTFKFGLEPESYFAEVEQALKMKHISLEGVMYHGGIPRRAGYYREETEELVDMIGQIKKQTGWAPQYLNIGGGFVPERAGQELPPTIEDYATAISEAITGKCEEHDLPVPVLLAEPGRYCVDAAGIWVTRVGSLKSDTSMANKKWVYVDGNTNEMGDPFDPYNRIHHVVIANDAQQVRRRGRRRRRSDLQRRRRAGQGTRAAADADRRLPRLPRRRRLQRELRLPVERDPALGDGHGVERTRRRRAAARDGVRRALARERAVLAACLNRDDGDGAPIESVAAPLSRVCGAVSVASARFVDRSVPCVTGSAPLGLPHTGEHSSTSYGQT